MFSKKIREKGKVAFANGLSLDENPYRRGSRKHMIKAAWWDSGWQNANTEQMLKRSEK